jgi:outer membrane protein assembly complex protein YaeT
MNQTPTDQTSMMADEPPRKQRSRWRRFLRFCAALILIAGLGGLGTWLYLRSESFNRFVTGQIKSRLKDYGLRAEIGGFGLSLKGQSARLTNLKIYNDQSGELIASIKGLGVSVNIREPYALSLSREIDLQNVDIEGLEVFFIFDEKGRNNFSGLHAPPQTGPKRLTIDYTKLLARITDARAHYEDRQHKIRAVLENLEITAQPQQQKPEVIEAVIASNRGLFGFEGRDAKITNLDLTAVIASDGVDLKKINIASALTNGKAEGRLSDWRNLRYRFSFDNRAKLEEVSRIFFPALKMKGEASGSGSIEGSGDLYNIKAEVTSQALSIEESDYRDARVSQFALNGKGPKFKFNSRQVQARQVSFGPVTIQNAVVNDVKGESANKRTLITAPSASVATVEWPQSKLTGLDLLAMNVSLDAATRTFGYKVEADARLKEGEIAGVAFAGATAKALYDNTALNLTGIESSVFGGRGEGEFLLPVASGVASRAKGKFSNLQTSEVLTYVVSQSGLKIFEKIPVAGLVSGEGEIGFIGANPESIGGNVNARFEGRTTDTSDQLPVAGDAVVTASGGVFNFDKLEILAGQTKIDAVGTLSVTGDSELRIKLSSKQAEQLLQIARSFEDARPYIAEYEPQIIGDAEFEGILRSRKRYQAAGAGEIQTTLEGNVNASTIGLRDALLGSLRGYFFISQDEFRIDNGQISSTDATSASGASFNFSTPVDPKNNNGRLDARITKMSLENILAAAGSPDAEKFISGNVSGEIHLTGLPGSITGTSQLSLTDAKIVDQPADRVAANLIFDGKIARLENLEVRMPQSRFAVTGEMNLDDYSFKANGRASRISLENLAESFELKNTTIGGTADAEMVVSGKILTGKKTELDYDSLQLFVTATGKDVKVNGRETGEVRLGVRTSPGGRIDFGVVTDLLAARKTTTGEKPEVIKGSLELAKPGRPVSIEGNLVNQSLASILGIFAPDVNEWIGGKVSGQILISGPTFDEAGNFTLDRLRGGMTLTETALQIAGADVKIETPVNIAFEEMQIRIDNTRFTGSGIDLSLGGAFALKGESGMNFSLKGLVNLSQIPAFDTGVLLSGIVGLDLQMKGTGDSPDVKGRIDLNGVGFTSNDWPVFISGGFGQLILSGDEVRLDNFKANANDGTIEANGLMKLAKLRPSEWKYNIKAENTSIDYQNISATVNGSLTLSGNTQGQTLSGNIEIPQAEYVPDIDLDNLLSTGRNGLSFSGLRTSGETAGKSGFPPVNLNIRVDARDSLIVRNKQIDTVGSGLITLTGSITDPNFTGRIEADGGSVRFRGQRYEITVGHLELPIANGTPLLNLLAESQYSGYRVTLGFVGPVDDLDLTLRAEPQLSRDEILALITTGRTEAAPLAGRDPLRTGVGAAASLISSGFISKPTEQLLGLSRFQIDPVIRPNANPAARLTIGQQISRNLYLSYSTNLATEQDQTALAEYTLTNRFSALATFTQGGSSTRQGVQEGVFTIELRGRKRFSLGFLEGAPAPGKTSPGSPAEPISKIPRTQLPGANVKVNKSGDLKLSERKLKELIPVMTQGFSRSLARLGERRLREHFQEEGYFFADVRFRCEPENCTPAQDKEPLRVFYDIEPNAIYDLKDIRIEGTGLIKVRDIEGQLQSQVASRVGGVPFFRDLPLVGGYGRGLTSNDRLKNDEETIRRSLADIGFLDARVRSRLAIKPDNDELLVIFEVEEGLQSEVAEIKVRGNALIPLDEIRQVIPIDKGEAFNFNRVRAGAQQIKQLYNQMGYLEAGAELEVVNVDQTSLMVVYNINEGVRARVDGINIEGLTRTGKGWVMRYLDFKQGEILTPAKIRQTQRDLYSTNAFREVGIRAEPAGGDDGTAHNVTLNLTEAKPLLFIYGLGYSSDDGVRGLMELVNTNLRGSLDSLSFRVRASRLEQFAQTTFTDLRPFGTRLPTTVGVFYNRSFNLRPFTRRRILDANGKPADVTDGNDFGVQRFSAFIQTERKLSDRLSLRVRYNLEKATLIGVDLNSVPEIEATRNERAIRLGLFSLGLTRDTRDSVLNPMRGQLISADHSIAANIFGGNESFNKFFGTYQAYKTLPAGVPLLANSTLAFSARIGMASVFRVADRNNDGMISESERRLPISERFFSGGATTLRGFRFETAGPQEILEPRPGKSCDLGVKPCDLPTLVPIGGDALAIFNFELRYPLTQRLRLVPFYDAGNVFRKLGDFKFNNMTHTVGIGLRISTPLGPVGVDYGFLIDPPAYTTATGALIRQPRGAIHIRLGQSF